MDHSHISSRPFSSPFDNQSHNPMSFGSSLSTPSPFGSTSSPNSGVPQTSPTVNSPFNTSQQSPQLISSPGSLFYTNQSPNTNTFISTPPFTHVSPTLSSNNSPSGSNNNNSTTPRSSSPTNRLKLWKNRDNGKSSSYNQLRARRDEVVARFRGIDLSEENDDNNDINDDNDDFYASLEDPGANDPAWSWDAMCNKELNPNPSEPKQVTPWYVVDPNLSWEEFLYYCNQDRLASSKQLHPPPVLQNEQMLDLDDDRIDDKDNDPWAETKSEIIIEPLINLSDPNTMLCPYCKHYSLQRVSSTQLECSNCGHPHLIRPTATILMLKHRMVEHVRSHKVNCSSNFSDYTLAEGNIALICRNCDRSFNISGDFK